MTEPVALADLKVHLRLDTGATDEDAYLNGMITAARRACENVIGRAIIAKDIALTIDGFPSHARVFPIVPLEAERAWDLYIDLPGGKVTSVGLVTYLDAAGSEQTLDDSSYTKDIANEPARIAPVATWPTAASRPGAVTIAYSVADFSADDWKVIGIAMMLMIANWYSNREAAAVDVRGIPSEVPMGARFLLDPLKQWPTE